MRQPLSRDPRHRPRAAEFLRGFAILAALSALALPTDAPAHGPEGATSPPRPRVYTSIRQPDYSAFQAPGSYHGHPRHGLELSASWDRTYPPYGQGLGFGTGFPGPAPGFGLPFAPWPLSNVDIEVSE